MAKKENKIDFDKLEPLFSGEGLEDQSFSDEELLSVIKNPEVFDEVPREKSLNFFVYLQKRMQDSPDFKNKVIEALNEQGQEGE